MYVMGKEKDIDRIRELIIGKDVKRFEEKFDVIERELNKIAEKQNILFKKIKKQRKKHRVLIENIDDKNIVLTKKLHQHGRKIDIYIEDLNTEIQSVTQKSSEELKMFRTELMMHIKSKFNSLDKMNISKKQLAKMFETLSMELKNEDKKIDTKKHAKE